MVRVGRLLYSTWRPTRRCSGFCRPAATPWHLVTCACALLACSPRAISCAKSTLHCLRIPALCTPSAHRVLKRCAPDPCVIATCVTCRSFVSCSTSFGPYLITAILMGTSPFEHRLCGGQLDTGVQSVQITAHGAAGVLEARDFRVQGAANVHVWPLPRPERARHNERQHNTCMQASE